MADFLVAILSTLVIFLLSYLFWKWHNQRNNLTNEGENRPVFSRADMLKNRLKRFELKNDKTSDETDEGVENNQYLNETGENQGLKTLENYVESENNELNTGIVNSDSSQPSSSIINEEVQGQSSRDKAEKPASKPKPSNSRKWVTLSISDTENNSLPVTRPLTSLDELWAWMEGFDELNVSSVPLRRVGDQLERGPRTIVCHDMKGGYVQDR